MNSNSNDVASGSRTATVSQTFSPPAGHSDGVLQLRASASNEAEPRRVIWSDDTVDNEHMGKKKSKICCIYHKPKDFDESSEESSASSSDDGDGDSSSDSSIDCRHDRSTDACSSSTRDRHRRKRSSGDQGCKGKERRERKAKASKSSTVTSVQSESGKGDDSVGDSKDDHQRAAPWNAYERN